MYFYNTGYGGSSIIYKTTDKSYTSTVPKGIYSFAKVLKYLKYQKEVNIVCEGEEDYEIKLYLNNEIDEIPMKNE